MRCGNDDTAVGVVGDDGHFGSGRRAEPDIDYVDAAAQQRALDQIVDHSARDAGVTTNDDGKTTAGALLREEAHVGRGELDDIDRCKVVARHAAYGSAYA